MFYFMLQGWCCRRDLNSRPLPYQGSALPLSYDSILLIFSVRYMPDVIRKFKKNRRGQIDKLSVLFRTLDFYALS